MPKGIIKHGFVTLRLTKTIVGRKPIVNILHPVHMVMIVNPDNTLHDPNELIKRILNYSKINPKSFDVVIEKIVYVSKDLGFTNYEL